MRQFLAALAFVCLFVSGLAMAQSDRGSIAGTVVDSTGAAVSGASVVVRGTATGNTYKTVTTPEGIYRISDIAIGRYDITVEAAGFKSSVQQGVPIQINTVAALNVTLQPGDVKELVSVQADAPTLQTESSDIGTVVDKRQIEELPLALSSTGQSFLRSPETFVFLTPGTAGPGTAGDHSSSGIFESKLSGGQNFGTEVLLDGVSIQRMDTVSAFDQIAPSVEAISEFKVTTSTPSAQFGRTSGGVESFTTKSGTNNFHGTIFELFRNEALDANPWNLDFQNALAAEQGKPLTRKARDRQNDFGGSLGGPVRIPHLYNGTDKTFFFFSWEQYRNERGTTNTTTLPTDAERSGDFSALLGSDTGVPNPCTPGQDVLQGQIFDPSTTTTVGGVTCRLPFPGNKITNISPVAQKILTYLPHANRTGDAFGINNYFFATQVPTLDTTMTFRIDENLTQKSKLFFSYTSRDQEVLNGTPALPPPLDGNFFNSNFSHLMRFGWDFIASPTLLNHFVVGFNRLWNSSTGESVNGNNWPQVLGINNAFGPVFPQIGFNGGPYNINYQGLSTLDYNQNIPSSVVIADSISWVRGRHSVRFGGEIRGLQFSVLNPATSPAYNFFNFQTAFQPNDPNLTGNPFASFLIGAPNEESLTVNSHFPRWNQRYYALYVQDDFKFSRNLTLNLGLRWDVDTPRVEATGAQSVLDLAAPNQDTPGFPGALIYGRSATGTSTYYKDFGPRIGFAWAPDFAKNSVLRGGYSIYYAPLSYSDFGGALTSGTTATPDFKSPDAYTPEQSWDVGFPAYTPPSNANSPTLLNFTNSANTVLPSYNRPGMIQNWDLEIQHQIIQDLIFTIGYVGQHSTRLHSNLAQINTINPRYLGLGNALGFAADGSDGNNGPAILSQLGVSVPSWFVPGWGEPQSGGAATVGQLLRPFPQFGTIGTNCCLENVGQATYNALEAKLERRFRNGLNVLASYTFSKTLTDADSNYAVPFTGFNSNVFGAQNPYNLRAEKAVSYQDIPHTFVLSYMYEIPVGPGKRYLAHGVASKVLGGWQVGGVQRYQSGSPAVIQASATSPPNVTGGNWRLSLIQGQSFFLSNSNHWSPATNAGWNSACSETSNGTFTSNATPVYNCGSLLDPSAASLAAGGGYVFGNLPVAESWLRSPGYMNEDFAIIKKTSITENKEIVFKLDIPNAFNRHVFGPIDGSVGDSFFGVPGGGGHTVLNAPRDIQATLRFQF
ncbi:MAG TPA: carboxypeptidase regulatory-like domain-containing protein [Terriglobales bacterium]|nr:carboxypeptidase regulatory-like domain-containing protein [Terriglobales bacterium]